MKITVLHLDNEYRLIIKNGDIENWCTFGTLNHAMFFIEMIKQKTQGHVAVIYEC